MTVLIGEDPALPEEGEEPATTYIALLDANLVYFGQRKVLVSELAEGAIDLGPGGCDLQPGRYRWEPATKHFAPLAPVPKAESTPLPVSALNALAWLVWDMHQGGHKHLPPVAAWFNEYAATVDFGPQRVTDSTGAESIVHLNIKGE